MPKRKKTRPKTLGSEVAKARKAMKFTQEQLAEKVNMKVRYIRDLEDGEITDVPAGLLYRIAMTLGTTVADLAGLPITRINEKGEFYRE